MKKLKLKSDYDNLEIAVAVKKPQGSPKAVVQFLHGMCGCKERFEPVVKFLSENGVACIVSDHRGHGESVKDVNDLGYFYSGGYEALIDDIRIVSAWGRKEFPQVPYYLLGHSMGALAARIYAKQDDLHLAGLILSGMPSKNSMSVVGRLITGTLCLAGFERSRPTFFKKFTSDSYNKGFASEGPQAWICSDPEVRKQFIQNPRCNFRFTMNGANNLLKMMNEAYNISGWKVFQPSMPILFISGADDPCMISEKKFYESVDAMKDVGYKNVWTLIYPRMRHEVLNEIGKQKVWNDILNFVEKKGMFGFTQ